MTQCTRRAELELTGAPAPSLARRTAPVIRPLVAHGSESEA